MTLSRTHQSNLLNVLAGLCAGAAVVCLAAAMLGAFS